jgi:hypothetical protein
LGVAGAERLSARATVGGGKRINNDKHIRNDKSANAFIQATTDSPIRHSLLYA